MEHQNEGFGRRGRRLADKLRMPCCTFDLPCKHARGDTSSGHPKGLQWQSEYGFLEGLATHLLRDSW